jgi:hypothetical protein
MWRMLGYAMFFAYYMGYREGSYELLSSTTLIFVIALGILIYVSNSADGWEEWNNNFRD